MEKSKLKKTKTLVFRTCKIFKENKNFEYEIIDDLSEENLLKKV